MKDRHDCENQMIKPDVLRSQTKSNKNDILLRKGKVEQVLRRWSGDSGVYRGKTGSRNCHHWSSCADVALKILCGNLFQYGITWTLKFYWQCREAQSKWGTKNACHAKIENVLCNFVHTDYSKCRWYLSRACWSPFTNFISSFWMC